MSDRPNSGLTSASEWLRAMHVTLPGAWRAQVEMVIEEAQREVCEAAAREVEKCGVIGVPPNAVRALAKVRKS